MSSLSPRPVQQFRKLGLVQAILRKRCPRCRTGEIYRGFFTLNKTCAVCSYDFYPEPGFYLGAMMVPYLFGAMLTMPFALYLKLSGLDVRALLPRLGIYYGVVTGALFFYAKCVWLHLEFRMSHKLQQKDEWEISKRPDR